MKKTVYTHYKESITNNQFATSISCVIHFPSVLCLVIEVASGEYGDLNPVLFEAVQGGMCALEHKCNCIDKTTLTPCTAKCVKVSDASFRICLWITSVMLTCTNCGQDVC